MESMVEQSIDEENSRHIESFLDNQVIFPLIQKTILNESIQISLRRNDHLTIIEYIFVNDRYRKSSLN